MPNKRSEEPELNAWTPAFRELVSRTPALADVAKVQAKYRDELQTLEQALSGNQEIRWCLNRLERAGADRVKILHVLAVEVHGRQRRDLPRQGYLWKLKRVKKDLKSLARRLRTLLAEINRVYSEPETYPELLGVALQAVPKTRILPSTQWGPQQSLRAARAIADDLEGKARDYGELFRRGKLPDAVNRRPVVLLLNYVQHATGNARHHLKTLSDMLFHAYEVSGVKKRVSIKSLDKVLARHVLPSRRK
jgi:hypothetical protein